MLYRVTKKLASIYWHPDLKSLQNQAASCWG